MDGFGEGEETFGYALQRWRTERGLSFRALARKANCGKSYAWDLERGHRWPLPAVARSLDLALDAGGELIALAARRAGTVTHREALAGRPWQHAPDGGWVESLDGVRRFFSQYNHLLGVDPPEPISLEDLRDRVAAAHSMYQTARYDEVIDEIPDLLAAVEGLRRTVDGVERREMLLCYTSAYVVAAKLLTKLGVADLAMLAADRCVTAAVDADSLSARGLARRLPEGLRSRRAQVHLDVAWAQAQRKRDAEAILDLLEAERVAPEAVRYNVMAREIVREMLARGDRQRRSSALHDLAVRAGILD
jgi:transcriptional regulator with XRE-family HTH domain